MRRLWKIYKWLSIIVVSLFLASLIVVMFFSFYRPKVDQADAAVILGAAINTPALYNRTLDGLNLFKQGKIRVLILSGGKIAKADLSEAGYMEKIIRKKTKDENYPGPVPEILDDKSHNTYENIKNSRQAVPEVKSIVIVSDQFHLARAVILAKREGFDKVYWSAPEPTYYKKSELAFYYLREAVAIIAYVPKFIKG